MNKAFVVRHFVGYVVRQNIFREAGESVLEFRTRVLFDADNRQYATKPISVTIVWKESV